MENRAHASLVCSLWLCTATYFSPDFYSIKTNLRHN